MYLSILAVVIYKLVISMVPECSLSEVDGEMDSDGQSWKTSSAFK